MYSFFTQFKLMNRPYSYQMQKELSLYNISEIQWGLIRYIYEEGPSTFTDVAAYWKVENPSITPIAQKLIDLDLIYVIAGKDKRQKVMHLSPKGVEKYEQIKPVIDAFQEQLMEGITQEERETVEKVLDKLLVNLMKRG